MTYPCKNTGLRDWPKPVRKRVFSLFRALLISGKTAREKGSGQMMTIQVWGKYWSYHFSFLFSCLAFFCLVLFSLFFSPLCSLNREEHRKPSRKSVARVSCPAASAQAFRRCFCSLIPKAKVILVYLASQLTCNRRQYFKSAKFIWKPSSLAMDYLGRGDNWWGTLSSLSWWKEKIGGEGKFSYAY